MAAAYPSAYPRYYPEGLTAPRPQPIHGRVAAGFESVRDTFAENFEERCERGGALCVYFRGEKVVDLWAGERYLGVPWEEDTMTIIFSAGKGLAALGLALLHSRGQLDYDSPVARYWPEFGCNGKEGITVRQLLAHSVGICCIETTLTHEILDDPRRLGDCLAHTKAEWLAEDKKNGYMGTTLGYYEDQLCRRVDPKGRGVMSFVKEEICAKVGCGDDFFCGLPPVASGELDRNRIASMNGWGTFEMLLRGKHSSSFLYSFLFRASSYSARAFQNPPSWTCPLPFAEEGVRKLVLPASNVHATARAVAAMYESVLAAAREDRGGGKQNVVGFAKGTIEELFRTNEVLWDEVLVRESCFSLGFTKPAEGCHVFGSSDKAFGTAGMGGQLGFADPDADVSYAYVTNRLGLHMLQDPRELALRTALYDCIKKKFPGAPNREQVVDPDLRKLMEQKREKETLWLDPVLHTLGYAGAAAMVAGALACGVCGVRHLLMRRSMWGA